jgi:hypothetical protein
MLKGLKNDVESIVKNSKIKYEYNVILKVFEKIKKDFEKIKSDFEETKK